MTTHYASDLSYHQTRWPQDTPRPIADAFSPDLVVAAIRAIQKRESIYPEFIRQIAAAGTVYYTVHLQGRKAIYFGRHGEFYIEPFPKVYRTGLLGRVILVTRYARCSATCCASSSAKGDRVELGKSMRLVASPPGSRSLKGQSPCGGKSAK